MLEDCDIQHGKYMECHVAKGCRMYAAELDVRVSRKTKLRSYPADTYTGVKIWRGLFDDNGSFLNTFLMERKRVHPTGRQYGTYIDEFALYISEPCSHKNLMCNWGETQTTTNDRFLYVVPVRISCAWKRWQIRLQFFFSSFPLFFFTDNLGHPFVF